MYPVSKQLVCHASDRSVCAVNYTRPIPRLLLASLASACPPSTLERTDEVVQADVPGKARPVLATPAATAPSEVEGEPYDAYFTASKKLRTAASNSVPHPLGISAGFAVITGILVGTADKWAHAMGNAQQFIWHKVAASSRLTYQTGWRLWQAWASEFGTSADMTVLPPGNAWQLAGLTISFREACVLAFLSTLANDHKLKPSTINGYLSGVRFMLLQHGDDTRFIETSAFIKSEKTGINIVYRANHTEAGEKTLPLTLDMIVHAETLIFNAPTLFDRCVIMAMKLAYTALMRCSEYIYDGKTNHYALAENVTCVFAASPASADEMHVSSSDAYQYPEELLRGVILDVRSAKNDGTGIGNQFWWPRTVGPLAANQPHDIAVDIYRWAVFARPKRGSPFLSDSRGQTLTYSQFNKCIKRVFKAVGLNDKLGSTHSCRIGGASALATQGVPDSIIMLTGRWKSLAFLDYLRLGAPAVRKTLAHLQDVSILTLKDARRLSLKTVTAATDSGC